MMHYAPIVTHTIPREVAMRIVLILFGIALLLVVLGTWQTQPPRTGRTGAAEIAVATDANFDQEVLKSKLPVLVDFWAPWCGPCVALAPTVEDMADENAGKLRVVKVNVDDAPGISGRYQIRSIPTLAIFQGGTVQERWTGLAPSDLKAAVTEWVAHATE